VESVFVGLQRRELAFGSVGILAHLDLQRGHAHQRGHPAVHRIAGDGRRGEAGDLAQGGPDGPLGDAAQQHPVDLGLVGEHLAGQRAELVEHVGGAGARLVALVEGAGLERGYARLLRVGVVHPFAQTRAAQHQHETVLRLGMELDLHAVDLADALTQLGEDAPVLLGGRAAGAAVDHGPVGPERGEVAAHRHVVGPQLDAQPQRREHPAPHLVGEGVVAEEAQVARARAGGEAGGHQGDAPQVGLLGQGVEVRGAGGGQLGGAARLAGQSAHAVEDDEEDLAGGLAAEFANVGQEIHALSLPPPRHEGCNNSYSHRLIRLTLALSGDMLLSAKGGDDGVAQVVG